jgi:hypothetical protein
MSGRQRLWIWGIAAVLLAAFGLQALLSMSRESATSDEVPHLTAGYSYLKTGDFRLNHEHPPLVKLLAALPLFGLGLDFNAGHPGWVRGDEWSFGEEFINNNRVSARTIVFWGRLPMLGLGLVLGFLIFKWSSRIYGRPAGLVSLFLYAFCPNMLANAPLVTFDVANALFTLLGVYTFHRMLLAPSIGRALGAGVALGLASATKISALNVLPICVLLSAVFFWKRPAPEVTAGRVLKRSGLALLVAAAVVALAYGVASAGAYVGSLKYFLRDIGRGGRPAFLFGRYSLGGWWYYFLAAMAVKTPLPSLILVATGVAGLVARKRAVFAEYCLVVPAVVLLAGASLSHLQLGVRYVLPVYPFLFILAGGGVSMLIRRGPAVGPAEGATAGEGEAAVRRPVAVAVAALLVWLAVGTLGVYPHYLAYFNELVGGPRNGYKCLLDSNLDWGQDLPTLADFLEGAGRPEVILSFFGTASPRTYGITYQDFYSYNSSGRAEDHVNSVRPAREVLVISANLLQCLYTADKHRYDWLKAKRPVATPGHSLFVYDITEDTDAHLRLGSMYLAGREARKAAREFERTLAIDPGNAQARQYLESMLRP